MECGKCVEFCQSQSVWTLFKKGWSLTRDSFSWKGEEGSVRKNSLKREVHSHQCGLSLGFGCMH